MTTKPSPVTLQQHSLGGCTVDRATSNCSRMIYCILRNRWGISFRCSIPRLRCSGDVSDVGVSSGLHCGHGRRYSSERVVSSRSATDHWTRADHRPMLAARQLDSRCPRVRRSVRSFYSKRCFHLCFLVADTIVLYLYQALFFFYTIWS